MISRVAARYVLAAYFNPGDTILFGKYKNKRGKILRIFVDEKGNPSIEVEPIPKGRKQNKIIGLYKIWKLPELRTVKKASVSFQLTDRDAAMDKLTPRVLNAYNRSQTRVALDVGRTWENEKWRIHRYSQSIVLWDLENAGRRGKKVRKLIVVSPNARFFPFESACMELIMHAKRGATYEAMRKVLAEDEETGAVVHEESERGVDVAPGGFAPISINGKGVTVEVGWKDFSVRDKVDRDNLPVCIPAIKGGIKAIPAFYRWVQDNKTKIENMTYRDVLDAMQELGIPYHEYCSMD